MEHVHTVEKLDGTDFVYRSGGRTVSRAEVMPTITPEERVGVVMDRGTDGIGAGNFVLSCVVAFYEHLAESDKAYLQYPNYYTFQATADPADYRMLDVYPDHKNVAVEADAECLLRAITDRAITVLLVPAGPAQAPAIDDITRRSGARRIDRCFCYAPDGQPEEAEFAIQQPRRPAAEWYETTADSIDGPPEARSLPPFGPEDSRITQRFREVSLEAALSRLPPA